MIAQRSSPNQLETAVQQMSVSYCVPSQRLVLRGIVYSQPTDTQLPILPSWSHTVKDNLSLCQYSR